MGKIGLCPKCFKIKGLSKHHVFPRRFFPKNPRPIIIYLCRNCHDELERRIPYREKLSRWEYVQILEAFIKEVDYVDAA